MKAVAEKYGVAIKVGNSRFSNNNCTTKIEIATVAESGEVLTKEAVDFNRYASSMFQITKKLGDTFEFRYDTYEIVGLKPRSSKVPRFWLRISVIIRPLSFQQMQSIDELQDQLETLRKSRAELARIYEEL